MGGPTGAEEREVARLSADVSKAAGELLTELALERMGHEPDRDFRV
jgi:hypothetical protein